MDIKYFGVEGAIIDERFGDPIYIPSLVVDKKEEILDSYLNPEYVRDENGKEFFYPNRVEIDDNIFLEIAGIYEHGIIYDVFSMKNNNDEDKINTSGKLIVAANNASLFIDKLDDSYSYNRLFNEVISNSVKNFEIFTKPLGKEIKIQKMYGTRTNNKFLKIVDKMQRDIEAEVIALAINNSVKVLKPSIEDTKKILTKKRK